MKKHIICFIAIFVLTINKNILPFCVPIYKQESKEEECKEKQLIQEEWENCLEINSGDSNIKKLLKIEKKLEFLTLQSEDLEIKYKACIALAEVYFLRNKYKLALNKINEILLIDINNTEDRKHITTLTIAQAYMLKAKIHLEKSNKILTKKDILALIKNIKIVAANSERAAKNFEEYLFLIKLISPENSFINDFEKNMIESYVDTAQNTTSIIYIDKNLNQEKIDRYTKLSENSLKTVINFVDNKIEKKEKIFPYMIYNKSIALKGLADLYKNESNKESNIKEIAMLYNQSITNLKENMTILEKEYSKEKIDSLIQALLKGAFEIIQNI